MNEARIVFLKRFVPLEIRHSILNGFLNAKFKIETDEFDLDSNSSPVARFPILIRSNGTPWDSGNSYLVDYFLMRLRQGESKITTVRNLSTALLDFLRFIEFSGDECRAFNEFYFPEDIYLSTPFQYMFYLKSRIKDGHKNRISTSTAKYYLNSVVNFFNYFIETTNKDKKSIIYFHEIFFNLQQSPHRHFELFSPSRLRIKSTIRRYLAEDEIFDSGNRVRPLSETDLSIVTSTLKEMNNRKFQLFVYISLLTGARLQTVATLRIKNIKRALDHSKQSHNIFIPVGPGTDVDTKKDVNYKLIMPRSLAILLMDYTNSNYAANLRRQSYYGDSESNYLFLTEPGTGFSNSYYISKSELEDRAGNSESNNVMSNNGQGIKKLVERLNRLCKARDENFRRFSFHDLRATFAVHYLDELKAKSTPDSNHTILHELRSALGHSNLQTTMNYLDYTDRLDRHRSLGVAFSNRLYRYENG